MATPRSRDWFYYADRDQAPNNPTLGSTITTDGFSHESSGDIESPDWVSEEWLIRSALVPVAELSSAAERVSQRSLDLRPSWRTSSDFDFAETACVSGITVHAWALTRKHPIDGSLLVELRQDFVRYHSLDRRGATEYYHPVQGLVVAETKVDTHPWYDPTASVTVHVDFLRDYLAARRMGLLICLCADRFANAVTRQELGAEDVDDEQVGEWTWLASKVHAPAGWPSQWWQARSTLRRNLIIRPHETPRVGRSPWWCFDRQHAAEGQPPLFIVDEQGRRAPLACDGPPRPPLFGYLYFRADVLRKYLTTPGYRVAFHMRNWGGASVPGSDYTIDVGINSHGLVNAFAPDLGRLSVAEQSYWASFSSLPNGEICEEMFQTRMQQDPPNSPGVIDLFETAQHNIEVAFEARFGGSLFETAKPEERDLCRLTVGPLTDDFRELLDLTKIAYSWVIESISVKALRKALGEAAYDKDWKQIRLLEELFVRSCKIPQDDGHSIVVPLRGLHRLRVAAAHPVVPDLAAAFREFETTSPPDRPRSAWVLCVDSVVECLRKVTALLEPNE
ncbi:MAG: hypothetical protein HYR72_10270 [Deltaproteobacteria bacterium]|nr:hypothetical protein [Deltaproteobacteria bacterium]MBI3388085.1 hypothetical protein [Deltaproteobacteria bacterium]